LRARGIFSISSDRHMKIFALVSIIAIATLIVDTMINQVADFLVPQITSDFGIASFTVIVILSAIGQYFFLEFIKRKTSEIRARAIYLKILHYAATIVQYALIGILASMLFQILVMSQYPVGILTAATVLSYTLNAVLMGLFAYRFFAWYRSNRYSIAGIFYGLSFVAIAFTSIVAVLEDSLILQSKDPVVTPESEVFFPSFESGGIVILDIIHQIYQYSALISFVLVWIATAILLKSYSQRLGKTKYWIIISLPLVYLLTTFIEFFGLYSPSSDSELFFFYLYASLNSTAGGILFGVAFKIIANRVPSDSNARDYLMISAYGFILLAISSQTTLIASSYPPFGLATLTFYGLSAYLVLVGLYSTVISVSHDIELRRSIAKSATEQSNLIRGIATAQMQLELQNRVMAVERKHRETLIENSGVQPSLTEEDMKDYLERVLNEIERTSSKRNR
jgi:hypothetical protein